MSKTTLGALIGKSYDAPEVQAFVSNLGKPDIDGEVGAPTSVYYTFEKSRVTVITDTKTKRVTTIYLEPPKGKQEYRGELPFGLRFDMSREQIKQALSRDPDNTKAFFDAWEMGDHTFRVDYKAGAIKLIGFLAG